MRLKILNVGHTITQKLLLKLVTLQTGHLPPPIRVLTYRRNWFGAHFLDCLTEGMRQSKEWSKSEAELFAAFVSKLNRCEY